MANTELLALFDSLSSQASLERLCAEKEKEGLHLEFKTKTDRSKPHLDQNDNWHLSRALSGFANSDGGILIWGIETNKYDQATKLKPIAAIHDFVARLKKSLLNSTIPVVDGVILEVIASAGLADEGFAKCLIPASDKTPHRAMLADREYFKRTVEGFYRLEHFDLEDMFGRRPQPSLSLILKLVSRQENDHLIEELYFNIINEGRGIAKYAGLYCEFESGVKVAGVRRPLLDLTSLHEGRPTVGYNETVGVIHQNGIAAFAGCALLQRPDKKGQYMPLRIKGILYCEGMKARTMVIEMTPGMPPLSA